MVTRPIELHNNKVIYDFEKLGLQWYGIIHYYWWTASIKPRLLFSRAGYAS